MSGLHTPDTQASIGTYQRLAAALSRLGAEGKPLGEFGVMGFKAQLNACCILTNPYARRGKGGI